MIYAMIYVQQYGRSDRNMCEKYGECRTPEDISKRYEPTEAVNKIYPPDEWLIECGHPPVKAWYKIQSAAYEKGLIKEAMIGNCKAMFFDIHDAISIYENELRTDPYGLWELGEKHG